MCGGCIANGTEIGRQNVADKHDNGREERRGEEMEQWPRGTFGFMTCFRPGRNSVDPSPLSPQKHARNGRHE